MNTQLDNNLASRIDKDFLPYVQAAARYIGGEINQIKKSPSDCDITVAICFGDIYEIAMSNLGIAIIYETLNRFKHISAERVFAPWPDAEKILRDKNIPLFSLENKRALCDFDIVGFSLSTELCYSNVLNMLDLGDIDIHSANRDDSDPIVIAGGSMAHCCEPISDFIDMFVLGHGEETVVELTNFIRDQKRDKTSRRDLLLNAARKFDWLYVPSLYKFEYEDNKITAFIPLASDIPTHFTSAVADDLDTTPVPLKPIVPFADAVQERISIEVMRGCPRRCLFCQASFCRRPLQIRSIDRIIEIAKSAYHATGFDSISLLSLSTGDYPQLETLIEKLQDYFSAKQVSITVPSMRVDQQLKLLPKLLKSVRKGGLTIAIEAASQKLRDGVNKHLKNEDIFDAARAAYKAGWTQLKLYFMVGLPDETEEDIREIVRLSYELAIAQREICGKTANINAAISFLVPKPHTPLSWFGQKSFEYFENAKRIILEEKKNLRAKFLMFKFHDIQRSVLESAIGRGDRRLCKVVEYAWRHGARFDLWTEHFDYSLWDEAFANFDMTIDDLAQKDFDREDILPWQHLGGPGKDYLLKFIQNR